MKKYFIVILLLITIPAFGQTMQLEEENISRRIKAESFPAMQQKKLHKEWAKFLKKIINYPKLSYDTISKKINYKYILNANANKTVIYNRILEWSSLKFGPVEQIIRFKNAELGKIILDGYFNFVSVNGKGKSPIEKTCFQTYIFTIKDNKFKVEIKDVFYNYAVNEFSENIIETPIHNLYPITNFPYDSWMENLLILTFTEDELKKIVHTSLKYIESYIEDYNF